MRDVLRVLVAVEGEARHLRPLELLEQLEVDVPGDVDGLNTCALCFKRVLRQATRTIRIFGKKLHWLVNFSASYFLIPMVSRHSAFVNCKLNTNNQKTSRIFRVQCVVYDL